MEVLTMMKFFANVFTGVGCVLTFVGMLAWMLCGHVVVQATAFTGLSLMLVGMALDKWNEYRKDMQEHSYCRW